MSRERYENSCLILNKLHLNIMGDTYLTDAEKDGECSRNLDDAACTLRTCTSKKGPVEISGTEPLDDTLELSKSIDDVKQRLSVYVNFSLPGSPRCIIHKNYKSKTNLKKVKDLERDLISELKSKPSSRDSLLAEDNSNDLNKAFIVAQNNTKEWLSLNESGNIAFSTRRSLAISGVSSNSLDSTMTVNAKEDYTYEEDATLLEKRLQVSSLILPEEEPSLDKTTASLASSLPSAMDYNNQALRAELIALGYTPGLIQEHTKSLYLKKLHSLRRNPIIVKEQGKTYSIELQKSLLSDEWMKNLGPYIELELQAKADFTGLHRKWREGDAKTSFTYLLLDPRLTQNLPAKFGTQSLLDSWTTFVNSIFYVGKGKRSRPYSHLYQALTLWKQNFIKSDDKKVQHIHDIWSDKMGVICLHIFQNVIPAEAYTHEAAMIDVLGLQNLKNLKTGNYYGAVASWSIKERKMFGLYLLYRAMNIFISEGERQLRPDDID